MTKSEFVDQVASRADLGKAEAGKAVDAVLDTIQETLARGSDARLTRCLLADGQRALQERLGAGYARDTPKDDRLST